LTKKGSVIEFDEEDIPGVRNWPGWQGAFTRDQAPDALFRNGARIKKAKGEPLDRTPIGTKGTVLGSLQAHGVGIGYFVEWDDRKRLAVFVVGWKITGAA
jgi:hypothetical protein